MLTAAVRPTSNGSPHAMITSKGLFPWRRVGSTRYEHTQHDREQTADVSKKVSLVLVLRELFSDVKTGKDSRYNQTQRKPNRCPLCNTNKSI